MLVVGVGRELVEIVGFGVYVTSLCKVPVVSKHASRVGLTLG